MKTRHKDWCPGWESNPHEEKSPEDFKSSASAIQPPGQWYLQSNESSPSPQQPGWRGGLRKDSGDLLAGCDSFVPSSRIGRRRKSPSYPAMLILCSPPSNWSQQRILLAKRL